MMYNSTYLVQSQGDGDRRGSMMNTSMVVSVSLFDSQFKTTQLSYINLIENTLFNQFVFCCMKSLISNKVAKSFQFIDSSDYLTEIKGLLDIVVQYFATVTQVEATENSREKVFETSNQLSSNKCHHFTAIRETYKTFMRKYSLHGGRKFGSINLQRK